MVVVQMAVEIVQIASMVEADGHLRNPRQWVIGIVIHLPSRQVAMGLYLGIPVTQDHGV